MSTLAAARPRPAPAAKPVLSAPWRDRAGRFSPLKFATLLAALAPGLYVVAAWRLDALGGKPLTAAIHETGEWAVRFLVASLAVSPLRRVANWPKLILIRRMLGIAALAYAAIHLGLYVVDQGYDVAKVASEIALRIYLTIGFVALLGLAVLGVTSTDAMIRRLGAAWHRLHTVVYAITVLALAHYFLQSKIDVTRPVLWAGLFLLLMAYRLMHRAGIGTRPLPLAGLAVVAGLLTAGLEVAWYALATGVPPLAVLAANLDVSDEIRPAWWVAAVGLGLAVVSLARGWSAGGARPARQGARPIPAKV